MSVDGRVGYEMTTGSRVTVGVSDRKVQYIRLWDEDFFKTLPTKIRKRDQADEEGTKTTSIAHIRIINEQNIETQADLVEALMASGIADSSDSLTRYQGARHRGKS